MIPTISTQIRPLRALLLGPVYPPDMVGGGALALGDVANQLKARGWQINEQIWMTPANEAKLERPAVLLKSTFMPSRLAAFQRRPSLLAAWNRVVPPAIGRVLSTTFMPRAYFEQISHNLYAAEMLLEEAQKYDIVLFCIDAAPPGMGALVTERLRHVAIISLQGLGNELESRFWPWARLVASWHLRQQMHPFVFRPLAPAKVPLAIFASAQWQKEAIQAGLPAHKARTIYFGVPQPPSPTRSSQTRNRLLWVGRLSREKGLHLVLRALPIIRKKLSDVTLTVVGDLGFTGYSQMIRELTNQYHLEDIISYRPAMKRADLQEAYATHDVLIFYSIFSEPVALVLMEAFAAGLPVVASWACDASTLVRDRVTCLCYRPNSPESLPEAVVTMLTRADLREGIAVRARQLVQKEFSLEKMGQAYDEALQPLVSGGL